MITTALTETFGLTHPIVLGPMEGVAGRRLATAVSNAGELALVGVVDAVESTPMVAAGGFGDGRELAAVLMLDAHGALIGSRFHWAAKYQGRGLRNSFMKCWDGRERNFAGVLEMERRAYLVKSRLSKAQRTSA